MRLDITSILKNNGGTISVQLEEALEDLETSLGTVSFTGPVSFTGSITNNNGMLKLTGRAKVIYSTVCDRCAGSIERELVVDIDEEIIEQEGTAEYTEDDRFTYSGNSLDLERILADCILTSVPMSHICREDCPGLCPVCGAEISEKGCNCGNHDSTDSRFEVLKGFFD